MFHFLNIKSRKLKKRFSFFVVFLLLEKNILILLKNEKTKLSKRAMLSKKLLFTIFFFSIYLKYFSLQINN